MVNWWVFDRRDGDIAVMRHPKNARKSYLVDMMYYCSIRMGEATSLCGRVWAAVSIAFGAFVWTFSEIILLITFYMLNQVFYLYVGDGCYAMYWSYPLAAILAVYFSSPKWGSVDRSDPLEQIASSGSSSASVLPLGIIVQSDPSIPAVIAAAAPSVAGRNASLVAEDSPAEHANPAGTYVREL